MTSSSRESGAPDTLPTLFKTALRRSALLAACLALVACVVGWLKAGAPGLYGALVGAGLAGAFLLTTVVVMIATAKKPQHIVTAALAGSWMAKLVLTFVVLIVIRGMDFYHPRVLVGTVIALVLGMLTIEMFTIAKGRVPIDLSAREASVEETDATSGNTPGQDN